MTTATALPALMGCVCKLVLLLQLFGRATLGRGWSPVFFDGVQKSFGDCETRSGAVEPLAADYKILYASLVFGQGM